MRGRPVIGISGPDSGGFPGWVFASWLVRTAGGRAVRITPQRGMPRPPLDGLILGGGADVDPSHYGLHAEHEPLRELVRYRGWRALLGYLFAPILFVLRTLFGVREVRIDKERDALELSLVALAAEQGLPVLGICRGAQLLNVHAGGTLHRDLESFYVESKNPATVFPRKLVEMQAGSRLFQTLGTTRCRVNSLHRQAVSQLGAGLSVAATERSGVVQAIERRDLPFWIGVQWHPEYLPYRPEQRRLFIELVRMAANHKQSSECTAADPSLRPNRRPYRGTES